MECDASAVAVATACDALHSVLLLQALGRCASSVVGQQLAEASQAHMQEQLTTLRQKQHLEALSPARSPLHGPPIDIRRDFSLQLAGRESS